MLGFSGYFTLIGSHSSPNPIRHELLSLHYIRHVMSVLMHPNTLSYWGPFWIDRFMVKDVLKLLNKLYHPHDIISESVTDNTSIDFPVWRPSSSLYLDYKQHILTQLTCFTSLFWFISELLWLAANAKIMVYFSIPCLTLKAAILILFLICLTDKWDC